MKTNSPDETKQIRQNVNPSEGYKVPVPIEKIGGALMKVIAVEDLRDLPTKYAYGILIVGMSGLLVAFVVLLMSIYSTSRAETFLSVDENSGTF